MTGLADFLDVRFKNQGLDLIEVQDNGSGISPANYSSVALKHHTSKLSSFTDIASLQTFGFRGEALSSLCALSNLTVTTCVQADVPRGSRLSFEPSGQLKDTVVTAAQRGTIVSVESLFHNLPVRRRELERNIKREWQKVVALLSQYACIQVNVKLSVSQQPTKGKRVALFSTKGNRTTRENIINIFGARTMSALVLLDLELEIQPTKTTVNPEATPGTKSDANIVRVVGHISRPSPGDGRQMPDRQMFFVNGRPCGLPQFAKTFNEVYRSFNHSQSPFIFADVRLDTQMYDVNVSPDKRSILLHDQGRLLDTLRKSLATLFDSHDCTVPVSELGVSNHGPGHGGVARPIAASLTNSKLRPEKPQEGEIRPREDTSAGCSVDSSSDSDAESSPRDAAADVQRMRHKPSSDQNMMSQWLKNDSKTATPATASVSAIIRPPPSPRRELDSYTVAETPTNAPGASLSVKMFAASKGDSQNLSRPVRDFNSRLAENTATASVDTERTKDDTASSVSSQAAANDDDEDELDEETDVRAVRPLRLSNRGPTHSLPFKSPSMKRTGNVSPTSDNNFRLKVGRISDECDEPGSKGSSPKSNGSVSANNLNEEVVGDGMRPLHRWASSTLPHEDSRPSGDDVVHDLQTRFPSGDEGSRSDSELDTLSNQPTPPDPGIEARDEPISVSCNPAPQTQPAESGPKRGNTLWQAVQRLPIDELDIRSRMVYLESHRWTGGSTASTSEQVEDLGASDAEEKLTLTISRSDFSSMRVVGQFNMGFIIAVRPAAPATTQLDELFIIDQHASDEKYNFERLQSTTIVQSQRLVHPRNLQLTALEEEIVMGNLAAIEANGFKVSVDSSGGSPVGSRCEILALPLSRETTFSLDDLEELIALLGEAPTESDHIPRPSKVRKMFAMRACRSSVMIGKALTGNQMYALVRQMGELDKPWNCPHGRPTMRHLCRLQAWDGKRWRGDTTACSATAWRSYARGE